MGIGFWGWPTARTPGPFKQWTDAEKRQWLLEISKPMLALWAKECALTSALSSAVLIKRLEQELVKDPKNERLSSYLAIERQQRNAAVERYYKEKKVVLQRSKQKF